jgi:hypothetical protein
MPPLQALVALHGLWFLAFAGFARWIASKWPPERVKLLGIAFCVMGLAGLVGLVGHDVLSWYQGGSSIYRKYMFQRALFVVGTTPDIPVIQTMVTGMALWVLARRSSRPGHAEPYEPEHERRVFCE